MNGTKRTTTARKTFLAPSSPTALAISKVSLGDTIVFKNSDSTTHHVVMDNGSMDFGDIAPGASKSATLANASGNFHCTIHSTMVGAINGKVPDPPPCDNPGYCP